MEKNNEDEKGAFDPKAEEHSLEEELDECSSKIISDPSNAQLYLERARVYTQLQEYQTAILDTEDAIRLNSKLANAYTHKAKLLHLLGKTAQAVNFLKKCSKKVKNVGKTLAELEGEMNGGDVKLLNSVGAVERFMLWLRDNGAIFDKVDLVHHTASHRGIIAKTPIRKEEVFMFIPIQAIITLGMARETPIGVKITNSRVQLKSPKHSYLAAFILQELGKETTKWQPYFDMLPQSVDNFPIFFKKEELKLLKGTFFLEQVEMKKQQLREDYAEIRMVAPEFARHTLEHFAYARTLVASRTFCIFVKGRKEDGLVPLADIQNHAQPNMSTWTYKEANDGFVVKADVDVERGREIYNSYGLKCNSRYFLNYGFVVEDNGENEIPVVMQLDAKDPLFWVKCRMNERSQIMQMRVKDDFNKENIFYLLCYARFMVYTGPAEDLKHRVANIRDDGSMTLYGSYKGVGISPVSLANEMSAHKAVSALAAEELKAYPCTYEDDVLLLQTALTYNQRNCVILRAGEKRILLRMKRLSELSLELAELGLEKAKEAFDKAKDKEVYEKYINGILFPLMNKEVL